MKNNTLLIINNMFNIQHDFEFLCQCLNLSEDEMEKREVDYIDIVNDPLPPKHFKESEVSLWVFHFCLYSCIRFFTILNLLCSKSYTVNVVFLFVIYNLN